MIYQTQYFLENYIIFNLLFIPNNIIPVKSNNINYKKNHKFI